MSAFLPFFITVFLLFVVYSLLIRPWQLRWGATDEEVQRSLAGDDIVQHPNFVATRAVTINASPSEVWKWIIQIGSARAGWYSHDWVDNAGKPSTREILPQYQYITPDEFIPFTPDQKNGMWVKDFQVHGHILWWDKKEKSTWGWYLKPLDGGRTRLITRLRTAYDFSFPWVIYYLIYDFGDIVMMSKCILGIKARAEANVCMKPDLLHS